MNIADFTVPEIEYFRKNCNFIGLEKDLFEMRVSGNTLDEIAEALNISRDWAGKLSQKVNRKIIKVL